MTRPAFALPRLRAALFTPLVKRLCKPLAAALAIAGPGAVGATGLPAEVSEALRQASIPPEAGSMVVVPVDGTAPRLAHLSEVSRQPASLIKLFTTGAALSTLGPAFSWRTEAALGGPLLPDGRLAGPLFLRGSGDPSLVLEKVWLMMARWRAAGLRDIEGGIVLDRRAFDLPAHDPAAFDQAPLKPYNAGPDALLLNHQAITLRLAPDTAQPGRMRVSMEPALDGVQLESQILLRQNEACGAWRDHLLVDMAPAPLAGRTLAAGEQAPWTLSVRGSYAASCGAREWPLLWQGQGAGDHAARLLAQVWRDLGGTLGAAAGPDVVAPVRDGVWPAQAAVWQVWASPPLRLVVQDINKFSNNVMARQLFLTMAPAPGPATLDKAREAVSRVVREATQDTAAPSAGRSPCDGDALVLDNGSGLSRQERSSAACLARWLQAMWASPVMPELLASLPVTGVDGTARRLGQGGTLGRAHIKTGSLEGVTAIAGVVLGESGRRHVVVGIVNHPLAQRARPALDALLGWAARDAGPQSAGAAAPMAPAARHETVRSVPAPLP